MRRQPSLSRTAAGVGGALLFLTMVGASSAFSQSRAPSGNAREAAMWAELRSAKGTLLGSLRMADCSGYPSRPCRNYLIQAFGYRLPGVNPTKLIVTDLDRHKIIYVDREVYGFLYMFPLNQWANLLATVWGSADSNGGVKVYLLTGDRVSVVFENGSRFSPQFIVANEATPIPLIMLDRYTGGIDEIRPQETEIWRWDSAKEKFYAAATVPANQRFEAVAKLEREAKKK